MKWYKGNIHTHTTESDGDASPQDSVRWYRRHGYDFLVLSDHNHLTLLDYGQSSRRSRRPLMIPGEEVSVTINRGMTSIHLNGIGINRMVEPIDGGEVVPTLQANVDAILQAGGIASINHPNFTWAFDHQEIKQVRGAHLLEVFNGHPAVNMYGAPGKPSYEEIWDGVLSAGTVIFGVATDDSHNYKQYGPTFSNPGRGWVMVQAADLSGEAIVEGLASGNFYASTGVTLSSVALSQEHISLTIEPLRDCIYTTTFSGPNGEVLSRHTGIEPAYRLLGNEGYVRATVVSSSGPKAWTQPVFPA
ncbi:MAG: PHP domain-containing protein [Dehalococcoidia bacterium]